MYLFPQGLTRLQDEVAEFERQKEVEIASFEQYKQEEMRKLRSVWCMSVLSCTV